MKVGPNTHALEPSDREKTGPASPAPASDVHVNEAAGVDKPRFSCDQKRLQSLEAQAMAQPEVREQKVEALRQAIGKGEYAVSNVQVADAMIAELGGENRRKRGAAWMVC
jgi:flagellar biosynthesis anti-sigma factor FlgM